MELIRNSALNYRFEGQKRGVGLLTDLFNEITGCTVEPYVMGGGTYARKLPNAFGYGIGSMPERKRIWQAFCSGRDTAAPMNRTRGWIWKNCFLRRKFILWPCWL